jgi:biotin carboxyl carrier protein
MIQENLLARVDVESDGETRFLVRSPTVGFASTLPEVGTYLNAEQVFLTLVVLGRRVRVQLPRRVHGHVAERFVEGTHVPVEYGQPLFRLEVHHGMPGEGDASQAVGAAAGPGADDLVPVPAPSDGIFYRRASPDSEPYVEEGAKVQKGTVLGLVEVMKCFNQILYGGPGLPDEGVVVAIEAEDGSEVEFGAPLFYIRPA